MQHFLKVAEGIDTLPALLQLHDNPDLWDEFTERTVIAGSPHKGVSDIWLRYRARDELTEPAKYAEPHFPVWYPAWAKLPALRPIVFGLAARCDATAIGGVLITRIPPGGQVAPHSDRGSWHPEFYTCKVYVPLAGNGQCVNRCEDETVVMLPGSAWTFNNLVTHSVENQGDDERITLIISFRREG